MQPTLKRRVHLIANAKSGKGQGESISEIAAKLCHELNTELITYSVENSEEILKQAQNAVAAAKNSDDVVIAAGGDGTIRSVAEVAAGQPVQFAVAPCGTFNFFARTHQIPEDHEAALRLAITGIATPVRLGEINGRTFLINASLGLYVKAIKEREENTKRFGRKRLVVIASMLLTLLKKHRLLHVALKTSGVDKLIKTPMIFIGNNALQLQSLALPVSIGLKQDMLAVITLKPVRGWEMLRVIFRGIMKTLKNEERLDHFSTDSLTIEIKRKSQTVMLDGELFKMTSPFNIQSVPGALQMIKLPKTIVTDEEKS